MAAGTPLDLTYIEASGWTTAHQAYDGSAKGNFSNHYNESVYSNSQATGLITWNSSMYSYNNGTFTLQRFNPGYVHATPSNIEVIPSFASGRYLLMIYEWAE